MLANRVYEQSVTNGLGNFTLDGAPTGYRTFSEAFDAGDVIAYAIVHRTKDEWEVGLGYLNGAGELVRETQYGDKVSFTDGLKDVYNTAPADAYLPAIGTVEPTPFPGKWWYNEALFLYDGTEWRTI